MSLVKKEIWFRKIGLELKRGIPPVVLIHGAGSSSAVWLNAAKTLGRRFCCLIPDLPGHGKSKAPLPSTMRGYVDSLMSALEEQGIDRCVLIGHSMGGAVALLGAMMYPRRVCGLVVVGCGCRVPIPDRSLDLLKDSFSGWKRVFEDTGFSDIWPSEKKKIFLNNSIVADRDTLIADLQLCRTFDVQAPAKTLKVPTLIIFGEEERIIPVLYGDLLRETIDGAIMRMVEGAGHMVPLEQPVPLAYMLTYFLEDLPLP